MWNGVGLVFWVTLKKLKLFFHFHHKAKKQEPMSTQSQINKEWQTTTTWYPKLIGFHGKPSDVEYLQGEVPHWGTEWMLPLSFIDALPGKEGLIIGKGGSKLVKIQDDMNDKFGGRKVLDWNDGSPLDVVPASVQAIWAKKLPDGMTVFTVYGDNASACLQVLQMIRDSAMKIMQDYGWMVFPKYWQIAAIIKNFKHSGWTEEKEATEKWNTRYKRYTLYVERDIRETSTHGIPHHCPSRPAYADWDRVYENEWIWHSPMNGQRHSKIDLDDPEISKSVLTNLQSVAGWHCSPSRVLMSNVNAPAH